MSAGNSNTQTGAAASNSADELRRKSAEIKQSAQDLSAAARQAAADKANELRDTANQYYEMSRDRVYQAEATVEDYIRDQPLKSVMIAAGIGFLIGACYIRR